MTEHTIHAGATALIVGGTSGIGLATARSSGSARPSTWPGGARNAWPPSQSPIRGCAHTRPTAAAPSRWGRSPRPSARLTG